MATEKTTETRLNIRANYDFRLRLKAAARITQDTASRLMRMAAESKIEEIARQYPDKFESEVQKLSEAA